LGIHNGQHKELFGEGITIKGLIPFYPANGLAQAVIPNADSIFNDPSDLVDSNAPPALVFHGNKDGMVPPEKSIQLKEKYTNAGVTECAIIWMDFSGHAGDLHYFGPYSQIFLFYMERFLALYR
jgi:predicted esterase